MATTFANADFKSGSEVFITYGHRSNHDLFLFSGFVDVSMTKYDYAKIWVAIPVSDQLYAQKAKVLSKFGLKPSCHLDLCGSPIIESSKPLLVFLTVLYMDAQSLDVVDTLMSKSDGNPGQIEIDERAFLWVRERIGIMMKSLKLNHSRIVDQGVHGIVRDVYEAEMRFLISICDDQLVRI